MSNDPIEHDEKLSDDLKPFEAMLGSLQPSASRINRDRLMYEAGGAAMSESSRPQSRRTKGWLWPCVSAALLLICVTLGSVLMLRGQSAERIVYVSRPADAPAVPIASTPRTADEAVATEATTDFPPSEQSNLALRQRALRLGIDSIGIPHDSHPGPSTSEIGNRSLLNRMLGT